jgi:hypothetical protein
MPHCKGLPLALVGVVGGALVGSVITFRALPVLHLLWNPVPWSPSCSLLWGGWLPASVVTAAVVRTFLTSLRPSSLDVAWS